MLTGYYSTVTHVRNLLLVDWSGVSLDRLERWRDCVCLVHSGIPRPSGQLAHAGTMVLLGWARHACSRVELPPVTGWDAVGG